MHKSPGTGRTNVGPVHNITMTLQVTVPEHLLSSPKDSSLEAAEDVTRQLGISALFATWTVSKITVIMWTNWIVVTIGYYGISLGIGDIGSNVIVNFVLVLRIHSNVFAKESFKSFSLEQ